MLTNMTIFKSPKDMFSDLQHCRLKSHLLNLHLIKYNLSI